MWRAIMRGAMRPLVPGACGACILTPDANPDVPDVLTPSLATAGATPLVPRRHGTAITRTQLERSLMTHSPGRLPLEAELPQAAWRRKHLTSATIRSLPMRSRQAADSTSDRRRRLAAPANSSRPHSSLGDIRPLPRRTWLACSLVSGSPGQQGFGDSTVAGTHSGLRL